MTRQAAAVALALALLAAAAFAEDWPQWRGPRADGTSLEGGLPTLWGTETGVCWGTNLPGAGHSSPIVAAGSVFVTTALRAMPALEASLVLLIEPVLNPVWAWVVKGERPGRWALLGGAAIILATAAKGLLDARGVATLARLPAEPAE